MMYGYEAGSGVWSGDNLGWSVQRFGALSRDKFDDSNFKPRTKNAGLKIANATKIKCQKL